jgi:magnesium transporter
MRKIKKLIVLSKSSADPKILERIEKHRDNFNFVKRSIIPLRDSLYAIKSLKEDKDFKVISRNIQLFFSIASKSLELLEQIDSDMGMLKVRLISFFLRSLTR